MLMAPNFTTDTVQVSIFFSEPGTFSQRKLIDAVLSLQGNPYDGEPIALPIPPDAPPEIPRVILQSSDKAWRLQASPQRLDAFRSQVTAGVTDTALECGHTLAAYMQMSGRPIGRLALLVTRGLPIDSPAETLAHRFCTEEAIARPFRRTETFEIHNHKRYKLPNTAMLVNSWVRCKTGRVSIESLEKPAVIVQQDINTPVEELDDRSYTGDDLMSFLKDAGTEADAILELYFPSGD